MPLTVRVLFMSGAGLLYQMPSRKNHRLQPGVPRQIGCRFLEDIFWLPFIPTEAGGILNFGGAKP